MHKWDAHTFELTIDNKIITNVTAQNEHGYICGGIYYSYNGKYTIHRARCLSRYLLLTWSGDLYSTVDCRIYYVNIAELYETDGVYIPRDTKQYCVFKWSDKLIDNPEIIPSYYSNKLLIKNNESVLTCSFHHFCNSWEKCYNFSCRATTMEGLKTSNYLEHAYNSVTVSNGIFINYYTLPLVSSQIVTLLMILIVKDFAMTHRLPRLIMYNIMRFM